MDEESVSHALYLTYSLTHSIVVVVVVVSLSLASREKIFFFWSLSVRSPSSIKENFIFNSNIYRSNLYIKIFDSCKMFQRSAFSRTGRDGDDYSRARGVKRSPCSRVRGGAPEERVSEAEMVGHRVPDERVASAATSAEVADWGRSRHSGGN